MSRKEIVDNSESNKLLSYIQEKLQENNEQFDIATAYFNLPAFVILRDELKEVSNLRLLLGKSPEFEKVPERDSAQIIRKKFAKDVEEIEFNADNHEGTQELIEFLQSSDVEVRLYTEEFLHGKAYIWDDEVIIGSSNFTAAGLTTNNELNSVGQPSKADYTRRNWFEKFWEDAEPFTDDLITLLKESRFGDEEYTPYQVFLKTLYEYQKEVFEQDESDFDNKSDVNLTEFQKDGVLKAFSKLDKYGGCLVSDSVGLGKTYIAKRVIEKYSYFDRENVLVTCPASLRDMWIEELKDINVSHNIVSHHELALDDYQRRVKRAVGGNAEDIELVVVDESHNFRNPKTDQWENFFTLLTNIRREGKKPYVLMLSATPVNNSIWDLYHQLMLMLKKDDQAFYREGIMSLSEEFAEAENRNSPDLLNPVLNEISVRRTRQYVEENYPDAYYTDSAGNRQEISFPNRELNDLRYDLDNTYEGYFEKIASIINDEVNMTPYRILDHKTEVLSPEEEREKGRLKGIQGIFRTILLKRLESSIEAFRLSVEDHIEYLKTYKHYLNQGYTLSKQKYKKHSIEPDDDKDYNEVLSEITTENYDVKSVKSDLDDDIDAFIEIQSYVKDIQNTPDRKLETLKTTIKSLSERPIIVFAYYSDTVDYVEEALSEDLPDLDTASITGDTDGRQRQEIMQAFRNRNLDVLVATDVLSEGQNLQKAKHMINYDLHWNPTKMIQRAGRIDRIGSPYNTVKIHNFLPEEELETLIELVTALENKIADINQSIGLDSEVLGEDINPKVFGATALTEDTSDAIRRIEANDESLLDNESSMFGGAEDFWQPLKDYGLARTKEELETLPDGIFSGLEKEGRGIFFYYQYNETEDLLDTHHYWYYHDLRENTIIKNKDQIRQTIKADHRDTRKVPVSFEQAYESSQKIRKRIRKQHIDLAQKSTDGVIKEFNQSQGTKFIPKIVTEIRQRTKEHMKDYPQDKQQRDKSKEACSQIISTAMTPRREQKLRQMWKKYRHNESWTWKTLVSHLIEYLNGKSERRQKIVDDYEASNLKLITMQFIQ